MTLFLKNNFNISLDNELFVNDMLKIIGDLVNPIRGEFNSFNFTNLIQTFTRVSTMPRWQNADNLPIANYDPIPTWNNVLRAAFDIFERSILRDPNLTSKALFKSYTNVGKQHKSILLALKHVGDIHDQRPSEEKLYALLNLYHNIYDGSVKAALSLTHYCADILWSEEQNLKPFDDYLNNDVTFIEKRIKRYAEKVSLPYNLEWSCLGIDGHIRNSVAHKRWSFVDNKVILSDRDGWSKDYSWLELEDLVKSIIICGSGLEASLIIGFSKYQKKILSHVGRVIYDFDSIRQVLSHNADELFFRLDNIQESSEKIITCTLSDTFIYGRNADILINTGSIPKRIVLDSVGPRSLKALALAFKSLPMIRGRNKLIIHLNDYTEKPKGVIEIDIENWLRLAEADIFDQKEFNKYVSFIDINDK